MSAVHRLSPRADFLLKRLAASEGRKPADFLSLLVIEYAKGLTFEDDPDLDNLPAPLGEYPIR